MSLKNHAFFDRLIQNTSSSSAVQMLTAVTAYFVSNQLLLFAEKWVRPDLYCKIACKPRYMKKVNIYSTNKKSDTVSNEIMYETQDPMSIYC